MIIRSAGEFLCTSYKDVEFDVHRCRRVRRPATLSLLCQL